jgi:hypothetical protein
MEKPNPRLVESPRLCRSRSFFLLRAYGPFPQKLAPGSIISDDQQLGGSAVNLSPSPIAFLPTHFGVLRRKWRSGGANERPSGSAGGYHARVVSLAGSHHGSLPNQSPFPNTARRTSRPGRKAEPYSFCIAGFVIAWRGFPGSAWLGRGFALARATSMFRTRACWSLNCWVLSASRIFS